MLNLRRSISHNNLDETERAKKAVQLNYVRDGNPPSFKNDCSWTSIIVPDIHVHTRAEKKFISDALFDAYVLSELEKCGALNWCAGVAAMMPVQTSGDGNCLMHAASLFMWGYHDRRLELRRAVYDALVKGARGHIRERWKKFREYQNKNCSNSMEVSFEETTWTEEWSQVVDVACPRSFDQRFDSLEEIHIFVLANVLCRPIIVISQHTLYSVTGEPFQPVTMGGIYLPLLCDSLQCCKTPIVIGFANGHFSPLVFVPEAAQELPQVVPLVRSAFTSLPVHFKFQNESSESLLSEYLEVTEFDVPLPSGGLKTINVAAFFPHAPPHQDIVNDYIDHLVTHHQLLQTQQAAVLSPQRLQVLPSAPAHDELQQHGGPQSLIHDQFPNIHRYHCQTPGCPNYGSKDHNYLCSECFHQPRILLQGGQRSQNHLPSTVPNVGSELQQLNQAIRCTTVNCNRPPDPRFYPHKCIECHERAVFEQSRKEANMHHENERISQSHTTRVVYPVEGKPSPNIQQLQNAQGRRCITPGCQWFADPEQSDRCSSCFERFLLEDTRRMDQQRERLTPMFTGNESANHSSEINVEFLLGSSDEPQNQSLPKQGPIHSPFTREVPEVRFQCRTEGCTKMGSNYDYGYCQDCFAKSVDNYHTTKEVRRYSKSPSIRRNSSAQSLTAARVEIPPRSMSGPVDIRTANGSPVPSDNKCRTCNCEFYGNPALHGFCSSCARKFGDVSKSPIPRPVEMEPEIPKRVQPNDQPPSVPPRPQPSRRDIFNYIPCKTHGCARLLLKDTPHGLCDRCAQQDQHTCNSSTPSSNTKVQSQAGQSTDQLKCPVQGCHFYGSQQCAGYCSIHYFSHGPGAR
ncbi:tumor necrosis factor alpha-induced protein 3-like [Corticium candelabrum]|uniref:tumor necrosis factor alpha-induced protein 3-like n=1 Tax=Corticium candelabrum TaxID=121492 RepID=UPI002E2652BA|nr:tumor necrosis factor alpha-induced protein 3-like [Corticium candelabrum]